MRITLLFAILVLCFAACKQQSSSSVSEGISADTLKKGLEYANKVLVRTEDQQINDFVARYGWPVEKTPTGLRFLRYNEGMGIEVKMGSRVRISFKVSLINGTLCYDSAVDGPKEFVIGRSDEINGLEEGLMMMKVGDMAKLIIPSHLAFGLPGDQQKIPMRATVIYDVELLSIQN